MKKQKGACAICGHTDTSKPLIFPVVDHCHETEAVRGLLCALCNKGLGLFKDDIERLKSAIKYLRKSRK